MEYAILDVETTGLNPRGHDRVIEVAVVRLDSELVPRDQLSTLVNPERDVGPTWLHGIRAGDVLEAPRFDEIGGRIADALRGALIVGHNVSFDLRFLQAEFERAGFSIPIPPYIDTMSLAVRAGSASRRLEEACDLFGVLLEDHHSALGDARATAALFGRCLEHFHGYPIEDLIRAPSTESLVVWPSAPATRDPFPRESAHAREIPGRQFLAGLVADLPASSRTPGEWQSYYAVLDRALEDRRISAEEEESLRQVAVSEGLSAEDVCEANAAYLKTVIRTALADEVLSDRERDELIELSRLLCLEQELESFIEQECTSSTEGPVLRCSPRDAGCCS